MSQRSSARAFALPFRSCRRWAWRSMIACLLCAAQLAVAAEPGDSKAMTSRQKHAREAAQLRMLLSDMSRPIGPSDEALAPVKEKLSKAMKIQFLDTPMEKVVDYLQREAGITMLIDRGATGGREENPVLIEADKMTIKDAIDWACLATDCDWDVIKGVVVISTSKAIQARQVETRVYDIRGLLILIPNFQAPEFDLNSALSNTSSGGSIGGASGAATTLFSESEDTSTQATREEIVEQITTLVQDTVGKQSDWAAYGGEINSLRELNGNLIVKTTPRHHKEIESLLAKLAENQEKMVTVEARYLLVKSALVDDLSKKNEGQLVLAPEALEAFLKQTADPKVNPGMKRLAAARTVLFNGQRVFLHVGNDRSFLSDLEPVANAGADPTISVLSSGALMDIEARIAPNGKNILMTFRSDLITGMASRETEIPVRGGNEGATLEQKGTIQGKVTPGAVQPAKTVEGDLKGDITTTGTLTPAKRTQPGSAYLELPDQDTVRYRSSVAIPNGGAVVLTGASAMIKSVQGDDTEVVLVVRARGK